jgi:hypothetical protein
MAGGKGTGSTIGGLGGAAIGAYYGQPQLGAMAGSMAGGALDPGGSQPQQVKRQMASYDPYASFGAMAPIQNAVLANMGGHSVGGFEGAPNPFVGPSGQQQGALNQLQGYSEQASPAFGAGVNQMMGTIGGQYLDPSKTPAFQNMANARMSLARQLFGDFAPEARAAAGARGNPYGSSSQEAEVQRGGERIGTQAAQDIAQAGWQQYGAERAAQEAAAARGQGLAPGLASQVFTGNEQLRAAQQAANAFQTAQDTSRQEAAMRGQLGAMGLDEQGIQNALRYMQLRGTQAINPLVGPTPEQDMAARIQGTSGLIEGIGPLLKGISNMNAANTPEAQPPPWLGSQVAGYHG